MQPRKLSEILYLRKKKILKNLKIDNKYFTEALSTAA